MDQLLPPGSGSDAVRIDCDSCIVRSPGSCGDCVVTVLLGSPPAGIELAADERAAIDALADSGLVPPLRLVVGVPEPHVERGAS